MCTYSNTHISKMDNIVMLKEYPVRGIKYLEQNINAYQRQYVFLERQRLNPFTLNTDIFLRKGVVYNSWADCISDRAICRIKYSTTNWLCAAVHSVSWGTVPRTCTSYWNFLKQRRGMLSHSTSAAKESSTEGGVFPAWKMSSEKDSEAQTLPCQLRSPHITAHFLHKTCSFANIA